MGIGLVVGMMYYMLVIVCNIVNLCIIVIFDGVIIDNSLLSLGCVKDGFGMEDIEYQVLRLNFFLLVVLQFVFSM